MNATTEVLTTVSRPGFLLVCLVLSMGCISCASQPVTPPGRVNKVYREVLEQRHHHYRLKAGDTVTVQLYNRPGDLNQTDVIVLPDGRSDLFFMENIKLEGKTISEVQAEVKQRVAREAKDAEVSVLVTPFMERVHMVGQFERPATLDLSVRMTLHEAVSAVGGMRITGNTDYALLRRPYLNPQHPDSFRIDLNDESEQIFLLPGDQVLLERNWCASVVHYLQEYVFFIIGPSPLYYAAFWATI